MTNKKDSIKNAAGLAKLSLADDAIRLYVDRADKIIDYFKTLEKLDTKNIQPMSHAVEIATHLRDDVAENFGNKDGIISQIPEMDGPFLQVPKVI